MTEDIVKRLKAGTTTPSLLAEAADEIEILRATIMLPSQKDDRLTIERLRAENDALRAAGEGVVKWWLDEGRLPFDGAPYALFALREALGDSRASVKGE